MPVLTWVLCFGVHNEDNRRLAGCTPYRSSFQLWAKYSSMSWQNCSFYFLAGCQTRSRSLLPDATHFVLPKLCGKSLPLLESLTSPGEMSLLLKVPVIRLGPAEPFSKDPPTLNHICKLSFSI